MYYYPKSDPTVTTIAYSINTISLLYRGMYRLNMSDIESMMQYNDEQEFQEHCEKISKAYLELVETKIISSSPAILYVNEVNVE